MDSKKVTIIAKSYSREAMRNEKANLILYDRELLLEYEGEGNELTVRFKIGDGKTPYSQLKYIASMYDLYPNFKLCDNDYSKLINISLQPSEKKE